MIYWCCAVLDNLSQNDLVMVVLLGNLQESYLPKGGGSNIDQENSWSSETKNNLITIEVMVQPLHAHQKDAANSDLDTSMVSYALT